MLADVLVTSGDPGQYDKLIPALVPTARKP